MPKTIIEIQCEVDTSQATVNLDTGYMFLEMVTKPAAGGIALGESKTASKFMISQSTLDALNQEVQDYLDTL